MYESGEVRVSHLRIFLRTGRTRLDNPSLLEVETRALLARPNPTRPISLLHAANPTWGTLSLP